MSNGPANLTAVQLCLRNVVLTLPQLPAARAFENIAFTPTINQPYIAEQFIPATQTLQGLLKSGLIEATGLYVIQWYGVLNTGLAAMTAGVDALLALFPPGASFTTTTGDVVRIRGDVAPFRGQIHYDDSRTGAPGWALCAVKIPWRVYTNIA